MPDNSCPDGKNKNPVITKFKLEIMSKEEVKKEIEYLRDKRSKYGWRDGDSERFDELQKLWENLAHIDEKGKYTKAPEL